MIRIAMLALVALSGCKSMATTPDLSIATPPDLSIDHSLDGGTVDLAITPVTPYDLAWSACVGTTLAGTCVERFFEPFVACFQPAGHCFGFVHNTAAEECWQNGAHRLSTIGADPHRVEYRVGNNMCLQAYDLFDKPGVVHYCLPGDSTCGFERDDGFGYVPLPGGARYDKQSGIFVCPDGTQVAVGPNLGDCPVLNALLTSSSICDGVGTYAACGL